MVAVADAGVKSLRGVPRLARAARGGPGRPGKRAGARGADAVLRVPPGTLVWRLEGGGREGGGGDDDDTTTTLLADLTAPSATATLATGGAGGAGNAVVARRREKGGLPPRGADAGAEGENGRFLLELASLADAGLVGPPNAGKSTLLAALTGGRAAPRAAPFAFTTTRPHLGALSRSLSPATIADPGAPPITIADVPGLLPGAAAGVGRGNAFLRHVARCAALALVVDASGAPDVPPPVHQLASVRAELAAHGSGVAGTAWIAVANKIDAAADGGADALWALSAAASDAGAVATLATSGATGQGVSQLAAALEGVVVRERERKEE